MSGYKAITTSAVSQQQAEEFGAWLGKYKVLVAGLAVYQVGASGKRHVDNATAKTIKDGAVSAASAAATAPAAMGLAVLLTPLAPLALAALPGLLKTQHALHKRTPNAPEPIDHTEIEFGLANVSQQRAGWSEYLLGCYCQLHGWELQGGRHLGQIAGGRAFAARTGGYPTAWSERANGREKSSQPRRPGERKGQKKPVRGRSLREWLADL